MSISRGSTKETEAAASSATGVEPIEADEDDIGSCARLRDELRGEPGAREHDQACLLYDSPRFEEATQALEATQRAGPGPCDATLCLPDRQEDGPIVPGTAFADSATTSISNRSRAAGSLTEVKPTRFGRPSSVCEDANRRVHSRARSSKCGPRTCASNRAVAPDDRAMEAEHGVGHPQERALREQEIVVATDESGALGRHRTSRTTARARERSIRKLSLAIRSPPY